MLRSRIAPTPSGYLHQGNALNFAITWLWVRKEGGILRLRIDDRSTPEVVPAFLNNIFDTLNWMGMDWDEGPRTAQEHREQFSQKLLGKEYLQLLARLAATGKVFACTCTRKIIHAQSLGQPADCGCRAKNISLEEPGVAWRIVTPPDAPIEVPGVRGIIPVDLYTELHDFNIRRRDGNAAYHVVSLHDDLEHRINLVVRGMDLLHSTAAQLFLADTIGEAGFKQATFCHHPLIDDFNGTKLSKSTGYNPIRYKWKQPEEFYRWLSGYFGWKEQATSLNEMLQMLKQGAPFIFAR